MAIPDQLGSPLVHSISPQRIDGLDKDGAVQEG